MDDVYRVTKITKLQIAHQIARGMVSNNNNNKLTMGRNTKATLSVHCLGTFLKLIVNC